MFPNIYICSAVYKTHKFLLADIDIIVIVINFSTETKKIISTSHSNQYMHELRETGREALTVGNNTRGEGQGTNLYLLPTRRTLAVKTKH